MTSTITTMDELMEVEAGTPVSVGNSEWTRTQDGFTRSGVTVGPDIFRGDVARGNVTRGVTMRAGQFWEYGGQIILLIAQGTQEEGGGWWYMSLLPDGTARSLERINRLDLRHYTLRDNLPWATTAISTGTLWLSMKRAFIATVAQRDQYQTAARDSERLVRTAREEELRAADGRLIEYREQLSNALAPVVERLAENDAEGRTALVAAMGASQLRTPVAEVPVRVMFETICTLRVRPPQLAESGAMDTPIPENGSIRTEGWGVTPTVAVRVPMAFEFETTIEGPEGQCVCQAAGRVINRDWCLVKMQREQREAYGTLYDYHNPTVRCANHPEDRAEEPAPEEKPKEEEQPF